MDGKTCLKRGKSTLRWSDETWNRLTITKKIENLGIFKGENFGKRESRQVRERRGKLKVGCWDQVRVFKKLWSTVWPINHLSHGRPYGPCHMAGSVWTIHRTIFGQRKSPLHLVIQTSPPWATSQLVTYVMVYLDCLCGHTLKFASTHIHGHASRLGPRVVRRVTICMSLPVPALREFLGYLSCAHITQSTLWGVPCGTAHVSARGILFGQILAITASCLSRIAYKLMNSTKTLLPT